MIHDRTSREFEKSFWKDVGNYVTRE
jgi:hypothetical protein